ncbi:hAT dimerization domain, ribonuclease H-like domain protein [Tanacetum coccineum]
MAVNQTTNNNSIRSILDKEKLNVRNFLEWYRNVRIVLMNEQKLHHLEEALPEAPPVTTIVAVRNAHTRRVAEQQEVACVMLVKEEECRNLRATVALKLDKDRIQGYWVATCKSTTAGDRQKMKQLEDAYEKKKAESNAKKSRCHVKVVFDLRKEKFAAANKIDGYVPPSYNKLRTTLLQKEKDNVHRQLEPLRSTWKEKGVTITPCVVHTLNLAVKNICSPNNVETNALAYEQFSWIKDVHGDAFAIKNFIMNHNMRLSIFSKFTPLRLLLIADTHFASIIVMLKRLKLIKTGLQAMVISEEWSSYRDDDTTKANFVKEKIVNDEWWDKVSYILSFTGPIYEMIRACDTDKPCLHLVYEMWDSTIEKVKIEIYKKEKRSTSQKSLFYDVVHGILVARWAKNNTPLHCLAHSLNPRYYSDAWLLEDSTRSAPHRDAEISQERINCFRRLFPSADEHSMVLDEYAMFSMKSGFFSDLTSISMMGTMEPKSWWVNFGAQTPFLQTLAFRLLGQPSSSSCAERNWSTYAFIHSLRRNKLTTSRAQDLVYIHNNL